MVAVLLNENCLKPPLKDVTHPAMSLVNFVSLGSFRSVQALVQTTPIPIGPKSTIQRYGFSIEGTQPNLDAYHLGGKRRCRIA